MRIVEIHWIKRLLSMKENERWKIEIICYASEEEIQKLRNVGMDKILEIIKSESNK
jgi:hypothetical protein